jgi:hypothetical protein
MRMEVESEKLKDARCEVKDERLEACHLDYPKGSF